MSYRMRVRYRTSISASRSACSPLPHRQKVQLAGERTPYISVQDDEEPAEIFLRVNGADCSSELLGLYEAIARLMSLALQHGAPPLEKVGDLLADAKFEPCGPVVGQDRIKHGSSFPDLIGRHRLMEYCDRGGHTLAIQGGQPSVCGSIYQRLQCFLVYTWIGHCQSTLSQRLSEPWTISSPWPTLLSLSKLCASSSLPCCQSVAKARSTTCSNIVRSRSRCSALTRQADPSAMGDACARSTVRPRSSCPALVCQTAAFSMGACKRLTSASSCAITAR